MNRKLRRVCAERLRDTFHMDGYRPGQKAAVSALLSGRDLLCILPTGAGKSLCWQLPAVVREGLTLVISPLIALMQDQVRQLGERDVPAVSINSLMPAQQRREAMLAIRTGLIKIVFVSPEMLESHAMTSLCHDLKPWLVVVDEAHCVVEWGAEFRPAYARIGAFIQSLEARPVVCAMTATADRAMQRLITVSLNMVFPKRVMLPVIRPNLEYRVITTVNRTGTILRMLSAEPVRTVIFCRSRARTEQLALQLRSAGISAEHYHAGLERKERLRVQERFQSGETVCLTATTAFGMGVDIPDIRRVINDALPDSVTEMVQQSGRAGRDGKPSQCIILISPSDLIYRNGTLRSRKMQLKRCPIAQCAVMQKHWRPLRKLLYTVMAAPCIPAAFAESFGQRAPRCGCCSACRSGPLFKRVPPLMQMSEKEMQLWLLTWQRDAIARARGVPPGAILSSSQLHQAVRTLSVPSGLDAEARRSMERVMDAIRPFSTHEKEGKGI